MLTLSDLRLFIAISDLLHGPHDDVTGEQSEEPEDNQDNHDSENDQSHMVWEGCPNFD